MTCAVCAGRIEKGLGKLPGVEKATVNFAAETASVAYDSQQISVSDLAAKVSDLGYQVITDKVQFKITGMSCAACAVRLEKQLNRQHGVSASVNFATQTAEVHLGQEAPSRDAILAIIKKTGFDVPAETLRTGT